jgi:hypothetical protein
VEGRAARAHETGDHDGPADLALEHLRTVLSEDLRELPPVDPLAERAQVVVFVEGGEQHFEALPVGGVSEVVEARLLARVLVQRVDRSRKALGVRHGDFSTLCIIVTYLM